VSSVAQLAVALCAAAVKSQVDMISSFCDEYEAFQQLWPAVAELSLLNVADAAPCEVPFTVLVGGAVIQRPAAAASKAFLGLLTALGLNEKVRAFIEEWGLGLVAVAKIEMLPPAVWKIVVRGFHPRGEWHSYNRNFLAYAESVERNQSGARDSRGGGSRA
jgi:hypothetical protein